MIANGRLSISVTKVMDGTNTIAENFSSKRDLCSRQNYLHNLHFPEVKPKDSIMVHG